PPSVSCFVHVLGRHRALHSFPTRRSSDLRRETLTGLSGLGDLVLTCSSAQSRNFRLGLALGQGQSVEAATASAGGVTEGAYTAEAVVSIADSRGIDVPVSAAVHAILQGRLSIPQAVSALMQRPLKAED